MGLNEGAGEDERREPDWNDRGEWRQVSRRNGDRSGESNGGSAMDGQVLEGR
jgi:hypothetical protein